MTIIGTVDRTHLSLIHSYSSTLIHCLQPSQARYYYSRCICRTAIQSEADDMAALWYRETQGGLLYWSVCQYVQRLHLAGVTATISCQALHPPHIHGFWHNRYSKKPSLGYIHSGCYWRLQVFSRNATILSISWYLLIAPYGSRMQWLWSLSRLI